MKKYKKETILLMLFLYAISCTGCWDGIEINRRTVIFSLGIDKNIATEDTVGQSYPKRYIVTYPIPDMGKISGDQSIAENILSIEDVASTTLSSSIEEVQTKMQNTINFGHTKAIILGADLLKDPIMMREIIDSLERNMLFARSTPIFAVRGTAQEVMKVKNEQHPIIGLYIMNYVNNKERAISRYKEALLGTLIRDLRENNSAIIPIIDVIDNTKIEIKGGALIKGFQLKTWFTPEEIRGLLWVEGKVRGAKIPIPINDSYLSYTVREQDCKMTFYLENGKVNCKLDVTNEGDVGEYYINATSPLTDISYIGQVQNQISERIKQEITHFLNQSKKYNADIAGIGVEIYRQHPDWWESLQDNWDDLYSQLSIEVNVDTKIRRTGIIQ